MRPCAKGRKANLILAATILGAAIDGDTMNGGEGNRRARRTGFFFFNFKYRWGTGARGYLAEVGAGSS